MRRIPVLWRAGPGRWEVRLLEDRGEGAPAGARWTLDGEPVRESALRREAEALEEAVG